MFGTFEALRRDLRLAARRLSRQPVLSATIVATLALTLGVNTAVFSLVNAVLLRPLPVADQGRLVYVDRRAPDGSLDGFTLPDYRALGALALGLAAVGLHGVIALSVARRSRESGVRMAVGARPSDVVRQAVREALRLALPAAAAGLLVAAPAVEAVRGAIAGVPRVDPPTFAVIACVVVTATLFSTLAPPGAQPAWTP